MRIATSRAGRVRGPATAALGVLTVALAFVSIRTMAGADLAGRSPSQRAGPAFLLLELPSGRVVAEAHPELLATAIAPGSLLKLATLVAAVEEGLVDENTRIACTRTRVVDGKPLTCVHPDLHRPLSASEALGYSCNVFFATVAERLPRQSLNAVLVRLGLPTLAAGTPTASGALGLSGIRATPRQLLEAFRRVVGASRQALAMPDTAQRILRQGTELAARTGTASALAAAGFSGFAKTGTAPMPGGGYLGIVTAVVNTELPTYAIVVIAPGGAGADAAELAARLLIEHGAPRNPASVRVGVMTRDGRYAIRSMSLEEYVSQVVAGEMGDAASPAALEAMAITARTYVEASRGRHAADGFDVCDLTHCQVLGRPRRTTDAAAQSTSGLVLIDSGRPAQVFYSSWCGGHSETPSRAWRGARDPAFLPARPDAACADEPTWTTDLPEPRLRRVLEAAGLKGTGVSAFSVLTRHPSGRVAELRAAGMTPDHLDGNAFRAAAGRVLGWQAVKSTLFDLRRSANGYVLTGRGSGHGVGLCIRGALNRARRGDTRDEILAAYFPGLAVEPRPSHARVAAVPKEPGRGQVGPRSPGASAQESPQAMQSMIRVHLPEAERRFLADVRDLATRLLEAIALKLGVPEPAETDLRFHPTVEAYTRATGQPWWTAARTSGTRIDLLPRGVLQQRGILESTLRHEFVHVLADPSLGRSPLWVREGLAVVMAGEPGVSPHAPDSSARAGGLACPSDEEFRTPRTADASRRSYEAAGRCVSRALAQGRRWQDLR